MFLKKIILLISMAFIGGTAYCAEVFSLMTDTELGHLIESKITEQAKKQSYKYNYNPMVFKMITTYSRKLFVEEEISEDEVVEIDLSYKQEGLWGEGAGIFKAKCYATLINKDYLLTHKNCIGIDTSKYDGNGPEMSSRTYMSFTPLLTELELNGRSLSFNPKKLSKVYIDQRSGAALVDLRGLCLQSKATESDNLFGRVCESLESLISTPEKKTFGVKNNYGTIILSNMEPKDKVEDSFLRRAFFSPISGAKTIKAVKGGYLTVAGKEKRSYVGEPLFHRVSATKNILVGIKTQSHKDIIKFTTSNKYVLFSTNFTQLVKKNAKGSGIILTKDLNGNTKL